MRTHSMRLIKNFWLMITLLTTFISAQQITTNLTNLTKSLEQLANLLQQPNQSLETLLDSSSYINKKIEIHGYPIYFLKVLRQGPYDCQLHSLKNALYGINLLEHAPHALEKNIALLTSKELYEKLLSEWTKITLTCNHVSDKAIENIMEAIKNKTMPPENLSLAPGLISFFNNINLLPINGTIIELFTQNLPYRTTLMESKNYLHAFLLSFMYQNRSELNLLGGAQQIFQHTIALIAYKKNGKLLFLAADSWEGSSEYTRQRDLSISDAIHALTMQANDFYGWCGDSVLEEANTYAEKAKKNNLHGYWVSALRSLDVALYAYKENSMLLTEEQKKRICTVSQILINRKGFDANIQETHKTLWNKGIKSIKQLLKDLKVEC